ncbi:MAG: superoxide dismutase, partial [Candidatus Hydrothermae bacterium]|nr:superoxide dismutase [Candidatus Hydrothermae bacterium]
ANHSLFWTIMGPEGGGEPEGELRKALEETFGGVEAFRETFTRAALSRFGSGWAWLALTRFGRLVVYSTPNQDNPRMEGLVPVLGLDVWEHAYYLKYQNRRAEYVQNWWNVVDWSRVAERYQAALQEVRG